MAKRDWSAEGRTIESVIEELREELERQRQAITLVAECLGPNLISQADGKRLSALLWEKVKR